MCKHFENLQKFCRGCQDFDSRSYAAKLPDRVQFDLFSQKLGLLYTDEISYATPDKRGFCGKNGVKVVVFGNVIYHCGLIF